MTGLALRQRDAAPAIDSATRRIGRAAVAALYDELALDPKPGLVSFVDSGSHRDMDARAYLRSLFALRHAFPALAALGAGDAPFARLERAGIDAEARMLRATGGVNTHRGAIFSLGLLCASAGALLADGAALTPAALRATLVRRWGSALAERVGRAGSHGSAVAARYGLRSANAEARLGFPVLFGSTAPALRQALRQGSPPRQARLQALLQTIAVLDDTNLAHRGGIAGLRYAPREALGSLPAGGVAADPGLRRASAMHRAFVVRNLSPGGAADLLAAACWLQRVCVAAPAPCLLLDGQGGSG